MGTEKWAVDAREMLIEIERIYDDHYFRSNIQCVHDIFNAIRRIVRRYATFRVVEVVHGRWIWSEENECWVCSECEMSALNDYRGNSTDSDYCPNCGARMDMEVE